MKSRQTAFTLLELTFVIIILGIIIAVALPRIDTGSNIYMAAKQLAGDIRYTQHLAMSDDKLNGSDTNGWYKTRWTIIFNKDNYTNQKVAYTIFSDSAGAHTGNPDVLSEVAQSPLNRHRYLSGGYSGISGLDIRQEASFIGEKSLNLGETYGISEILFSSSCSYNGSKRLSFDHLGRPLKGSLTSYSQPYMKNRLITSTCEITLKNGSGESVTIQVEPETGYTHIDY